MSSVEEVSDNPVTARVSDGRWIRGLFVSDAAARFAYLTIGAVSIGLIFWRLQFSTASICCGDLDGFYHVKWSQLLLQGIRTHHFPPLFSWLPLTTLNSKNYVDHHLLFHIVLIPFTSFGDGRLGAKVYALLFSSLAVFSCYWLIVLHRISYPLVWLVALLACSAGFLFRMNMTKAMSLSVVLLVAGIHLLLQRKYIWLLPLMFIFALTYDMFVLLGLAAVIWAAVMFWSERRIEWRLIIYVIGGALAGFILNPYFPHNIRLFYEHILIKVTAENFSTDVGGEWYPYDSWAFLGNCFVAFAAMVVGYIAFDGRDRKDSERSLFFLVFSTILLLANARWKRFAEYWPIFAVLFAAFSLERIYGRARSALGELPADIMAELQPYLDRQEAAGTAGVAAKDKRDDLWKTIAATVVTLLISVPLVLNIRAEIHEIGQTSQSDDYKGGMAWIQANVHPGEVVFNTNWDNFPKMFYYDTSHAYVSGLDPTYLLDQNPDLAKLYDDIRLGKQEDPGPPIRDRFGANYVFTANGDIGNDFYNNALDSGWFEEVYVDDHCTVMRVREQKGAPAPDEDDKQMNSRDEKSDNQQNEEDDGEDPGN